MKYHSKQLFLIIAPLLFSCQSKKMTVDNLTTASNIETPCPKDGECTTTLLKNKSLIIKKDDTNQLYYQTEESLNTSVVRFEFNKKAPEGLQDGNYREEIVFEINNSDSSLTLSDLELQKTKMIFARLCFCRGQTGYYKVTSGNLKLEQAKNTIQFNLDFKITEVPQIINSIKASIK